MNHKEVQQALREKENPERAERSQKFFKTGPGEYGEGDRFLGIPTPQIRNIAKDFNELSLPETEKLLQSEWHEERLCALVIMVHKAEKADETSHKKLFNLYKRNTRYVNNWDLVDSSAHYIVGRYLMDKDRDILYSWAKSDNLWERRIAIISTFYFIHQEEYEDTLALAEILLNDNHDLIHKAVGWMLREIGNRDRKCEKRFLDQHVQQMPRTMLRYAIEKFPEDERQHYLSL
ncbi:DNA alkylation repair protein [Fodinibius halophilus]|uniref:DNA alkylation repair protein n=1 Tax=Fodinibius halophilus TaxID=1736908 RepID=A0A6M1TE17_9BACT|nr:DNA alkylation repair protein [Fodinibius halophilus]NGP88442.1 DNA alkylation repair protein [Fodinibius halophilus]